MTLTERIKEYALDLGYAKVGVTTADPFEEYLAIMEKRKDDYDFFVHDPRNPLRSARPREAWPEAKSIIALVWDYSRTDFPEALLGRVGRVYQARCYRPPADRINGARFDLFTKFLEDNGCQVRTDILLPERWAAARAGVARFGKNNFSYADGIGSFIVISVAMVDMKLEYDEPTMTSPCPENCRLCRDACPSQAIADAFTLQPKRCLGFNAWKTFGDIGYGISDAIPPDIREQMGEKVHGCDVCQEVCPRNREALRAKHAKDPFLEKIAADFSLSDLLHLDEEYYRNRVRPIMYNYISDLKLFQRNAAVAMGNRGDPADVPELIRELDHDADTVRAHVAWALGKIGGGGAKAALEKRLATEKSAKVAAEISGALKKIAASPE